MTKEELKTKLLEIADSLKDKDIEDIEWRDEWKEFLAKSIRCSMDNILSFKSLLVYYEVTLNSILTRYSRGYMSLADAEAKMTAVHFFYRDMTNYVDESDMWKIIEEDDKEYIVYRDQKGEVICDDPGQQMVLSFRGEEYGTGAYNFMWEYDMCGIIDSKLFDDKLEELKKTEVKKIIV